jgi:hypothetical protein
VIVIRVLRQVRELFLVIEDPRKLVKALEILMRFKVGVRGVDTYIRRIQGVILLDSEGYRYLVDNDIDLDGYILNIDTNGFDKSVATAIVYTRALIVNPLKNMVVGIDYGKNVGVAIVVNDDIVYTNKYKVVEEALKDIKFFVYNVEADLKIVRVGISDNLEDSFIDQVVEAFKDVASIEFIPEDRSSRNRYLVENVKLSDDEVAAINIALYREGKVSVS